MNHEMKITGPTTIKTICALLLLAVVITTLQGCGSPESKLLGTWTTDQQDTSLDFLSDGRCFIGRTSSKGRFGSPGSWTILDDGRIKIEWYEHNVGTREKTATLQGDTLALNWSQIIEFKKTPSISGYTDLLQEPPSKVVNAFFNAANKGQYTEAQSYFSSKVISFIGGAMGGDLKGFCDKATRNRTVTKIEIESEQVRGEEDAVVMAVIFFKDGSTKREEGPLLREGGAWKLAL